MNGYSAILFRSSSHSVWAARIIKKEGIERKMIPIPRSVSPDCGYCIRILSADAGRARDALTRAGSEFTRIVELGESALAAGAESAGAGASERHSADTEVAGKRLWSNGRAFKIKGKKYK